VGLQGNIYAGPTDTTATASAGGDIYLQPLIDHRNIPLALLVFAEHPDTLNLSFARKVSGWRGGAGASFWPWSHDTLGFAFALSGEADPSHSRGIGSATIVMQQYFLPNLRGELGYAGSRESESTQTASFDSVHGGLWWLKGRVLTRLSFDVGVQGQAPQGLLGPGVTSTSLWREGGVWLGVYLGRRWVVSAVGQVGVLNYSSHDWVASESFGFAAEVYLTEALFLQFGVRPSFHQATGASFGPSATFVDSAPWVQSGWASVSCRF
jgi:hypothetical protein